MMPTGGAAGANVSTLINLAVNARASGDDDPHARARVLGMTVAEVFPREEGILSLCRSILGDPDSESTLDLLSKVNQYAGLASMLKQGEVLWKAGGGDVETATEKELRSTAAQHLGQIGGLASMLKQGEVLWKARGGDVESATEKELRSTAAQNLGEPLPLLSLLSPSARQRPLCGFSAGVWAMWGLSSPPPTSFHHRSYAGLASMLKQGEVLWKAAGGDVESATEKELRSTAAQNLGLASGRSRAREAKEEAAATAPPRPYSEWPQVQAEHKTQMEQLLQKLQKEGIAKKLSKKKVSQLKQKQKDESNRMTGLHLRELKRLKRR
eukprot:CAMPEP_0182861162 /NCGR_PEP_ID=MMETSP0034_2-20130328/5335_1 /TAXON_ID=156128 /ORGANISM="Nephroselmis pyriformis, Strain CCMP717" /LENGTH=324 /DNA_ID=CAMNT_0024993057 /DNA_START=65 /DNA_END=1040 /DNA_ORIENTATION=-